MKYAIIAVLTLFTVACAPKHVGIWSPESGAVSLQINKDNSAIFTDKDGKEYFYIWTNSDKDTIPTENPFYVLKAYKSANSTKKFALDNTNFIVSSDGKLHLDDVGTFSPVKTIPSRK